MLSSCIGHVALSQHQKVPMTRTFYQKFTKIYQKHSTQPIFIHRKSSYAVATQQGNQIVGCDCCERKWSLGVKEALVGGWEVMAQRTASLSRMEEGFIEEVTRKRTQSGEDVSCSREDSKARKRLEHLRNKRLAWLQHGERGTLEKLRQKVLSRLAQVHRPEDTLSYLLWTTRLASCDAPLTSMDYIFPLPPFVVTGIVFGLCGQWFGW